MPTRDTTYHCYLTVNQSFEYVAAIDSQGPVNFATQKHKITLDSIFAFLKNQGINSTQIQCQKKKIVALNVDKVFCEKAREIWK